MTLFTDPKAKRSENAPNNQIQSHIKNWSLTTCTYIKSVTFVETTPVAQTIVEFYEIAHFLFKTTSFY